MGEKLREGYGREVVMEGGGDIEDEEADIVLAEGGGVVDLKEEGKEGEREGAMRER